MKALGRQMLYCHLSKDDSDRFTNKDIRESQAKLLISYQELVEELAKISYYNPGYTFFYRGQADDIRKKSISKSGEKRRGTTMYPTIFRAKNYSLTDIELAERYKKLNECSNRLIKYFKDSKYQSYERMQKFPVLAWAVLQHYDVCPTPLLDVTHSARVAASFALPGNAEYGEGGYFYVLALPHSGEAMSYSVDHEVMTLRLLSICPPEAKRPFYQEGYLIGNFPHEVNSKHPSYDFSNRLVAKYKLRGKSFWSDGFPAIPAESLLPELDDVRDICWNIKREFNV